MDNINSHSDTLAAYYVMIASHIFDKEKAIKPHIVAFLLCYMILMH